MCVKTDFFPLWQQLLKIKHSLGQSKSTDLEIKQMLKENIHPDLSGIGSQQTSSMGCG